METAERQMATAETYKEKFIDFDGRLAGKTPVWLRELRKAAFEQFLKMGFPGPKDEGWRFTRIRPLLGHEFQLALGREPAALSPSDIERLCMEDAVCWRLAFVNGHFAEDLSDIDDLPSGIRAGSLRRFIESDPEPIQRHLSRYVEVRNNSFIALNTAHIHDGAFVHIPRGVRLEAPIHIVYVTRCNGESLVSYPRTLVVAEEDTRASIVESYVGLDSEIYFTNAVTEIVAGDRSEIDHCRLEREGDGAFHMGAVHARLRGASRFKTDVVSLGGSLVRNDIHAVLDDEGIACALHGLYLANRHQHIDNHTLIEHRKPRCHSRELFKGILDGRAQAVFDGKIHVHPDAQKTDAKQTNRCVLLSDDAKVNTNPQLEIYADDVKCTHGATVGQIDRDAVFYMQSRGIPEKEARHILVFAFANEVLEAIRIDPVRERLRADLTGWLSRAGVHEEAK